MSGIDSNPARWSARTSLAGTGHSGMTSLEVGYSLPVAMQKAGARNIGGGWGMDSAPAYAGAGSQGGMTKRQSYGLLFLFLGTGPRPALGVTTLEGGFFCIRTAIV